MSLVCAYLGIRRNSKFISFNYSEYIVVEPEVISRFGFDDIPMSVPGPPPINGIVLKRRKAHGKRGAIVPVRTEFPETWLWHNVSHTGLVT